LTEKKRGRSKDINYSNVKPKREETNYKFLHKSTTACLQTDIARHMTSFTFLIYRPSANVNDSAKPDGRVGMLAWVLSPLRRNE
jgi:hypothetical protein